MWDQVCSEVRGQGDEWRELLERRSKVLRGLINALVWGACLPSTAAVLVVLRPPPAGKRVCNLSRSGGRRLRVRFDPWIVNIPALKLQKAAFTAHVPPSFFFFFYRFPATFH